MKISKDLKWIGPYLDAVGDLVPLERINKISYYKTREHLGPAHHKAITHETAGQFKIFIRTTLAKENRIPLNLDNQEDILFYLAHELSHTVEWEHGRSHFVLMATIFHRFSKVLKKIGFEEERNKCS